MGPAGIQEDLQDPIRGRWVGPNPTWFAWPLADEWVYVEGSYLRTLARKKEIGPCWVSRQGGPTTLACSAPNCQKLTPSLTPPHKSTFVRAWHCLSQRVALLLQVSFVEHIVEVLISCRRMPDNWFPINLSTTVSVCYEIDQLGLCSTI